jgi:hypothetical protein
MRTITNRLVLTLALTLGSAAPALSLVAPAHAESQATSAKVKAHKPDMKKVAQHLREHVKYPASRQQVLDACADTEEFTTAEKAWAAAHLPEGTYASADDVLKAMK